MNSFYPAFSTACFSLLALWLVVVQIRLEQWQASPDHRIYLKAAYAIALYFALPGLMSVLALVDEDDPYYWRTSFAIVALGGAIALTAMRPLESRREPRTGGGLSFPVGGALGVAAYIAAIAGYALAGALAVHGGRDELRAEEILLTGLMFLGFNAAWLLLSADGPAADGPPATGPAASGPAASGPPPRT